MPNPRGFPFYRVEVEEVRHARFFFRKPWIEKKITNVPDGWEDLGDTGIRHYEYHQYLTTGYVDEKRLKYISGEIVCEQCGDLCRKGRNANERFIFCPTCLIKVSPNLHAKS
jgi:hypothetical protein